jgi:hypothetical protein
MPKTAECEAILSEIIALLESGGDLSFAAGIRSELTGTEEALNSFLISNELWGGSGSVADSAFAYDEKNAHWPNREKSRAALERLMIKLGRLQIAAGQVNVRTQMWVEAFERWRDSGIR